ncbi:MAG TPA: quinone oxidoreductase [Novosphingobium sp.]|nr:quinone oxidoreductase [Novosphingobium sp.]
MKASQAYFEATGGPEVIRWREVELAAPGPGEVVVRNEAVGLNFIDTYHRSGLYPADLPSAIGLEAAGTIEAVGAGVDHMAPGDRVAMMGPTRGAYATARLIAARELFKLPDDIDARTAAAALLKGCTAELLAERAATPAAGDWALVHAAAGGVGQILVQWLAAIGVRVIGTAGSAAKQQFARDAGAEHVIPADAPDPAEQVRAITAGKGVRVAYDGVGAATWQASLKSVARRGTIVSFGNASGPVTGVDLGVLARHGSLFVTRPTLFDYYATPAEANAGVERLWAMLRDGKIRVDIGQTYPIHEAEQAHRDLEARKTTGSTLLLP